MLLIEDDRSVVEAVSEALADEGYAVAVASHGHEALAKLERPPLPDVILLDLFLPEMDGNAFRRRQLANPRIAGIPTFIFSAAPASALTGTPASGWLRKPVQLDALLTLVQRHCRDDESPHEHLVHFHDGDARFIDKVVQFLGDGLARDEAAIAIATPPTRQGVRKELEAKGIDLDALERRQQLVLLDAEETLNALQVRGAFPADRFERQVGETLDRLAATVPTRRVRAYGEMVDVLWQGGDVAGAIQLESLWNDLRKTREFSLLCGYRRQDAPCSPADHTDVLRRHSSAV